MQISVHNRLTVCLYMPLSLPMAAMSSYNIEELVLQYELQSPMRNFPEKRMKKNPNIKSCMLASFCNDLIMMRHFIASI